jgi:hypothetical protein
MICLVLHTYDTVTRDTYARERTGVVGIKITKRNIAPLTVHCSVLGYLPRTNMASSVHQPGGMGCGVCTAMCVMVVAAADARRVLCALRSP